jgi:hypothetical protein
MASKIILVLTFISSSILFSQTGNENVTENPDGSFTISEPKMLRGNKELPIYTSGEGACALFGFDSYLKDSAIDAQVTVSRSVLLNDDGTYKEIRQDGKPYREITCYNYGNIKNVGESEDFIKNLDGSITLINPKMLRGNKKLPIYTSGEGVCSLFGYDSFMKASTIDANYSVSQSVELNEDGSYKSIKQDGKPYQQVTCYNDQELKKVTYLDSIDENADGSFTITGPKILIGNKEYELYTSGEGVCALFGFNRYLKDSTIDADYTVSVSLVLNDDGSIKEKKQDGKPYREVTCYEDGNLKSVGTAGGVIYYHGGDFDPAYFENKGIKAVQLH